MGASLTSCENALGHELRTRLASLGFEPFATLDFFKPMPLGGQTLRFGGRIDEQGLVHVSGTAGIVLRPLNRITGFGNETEAESFPTVMMPLHLLHADRNYREWTMGKPTDAPAVADSIMEEVRSYGLPFLDRFGEIGAIKDALRSHRPIDWFVLNPEQRVILLAAIEQFMGSSDSARAILMQALVERADGPPKRRLPIERALERLASL